MYKSFASCFRALLDVLFGAIVIACAGSGIATAQQTNQSWRGYPGAVLAHAEITEDVTQCPNAPPQQASCTFNKFPSDAYDIHGTVNKVPDVSRWFEALTNGTVTLSLATGVTCAQIESDGVPKGAFSAAISPATVTKELFGERALAQGAVPIVQPPVNNEPLLTQFADINLMS